MIFSIDVGIFAALRFNIQIFIFVADWSAYRTSLPTHSYGKIEILDGTHLKYVQLRSTGDYFSSIEDSFTLVQNNHGPFVENIMEKLCSNPTMEPKLSGKGVNGTTIFLVILGVVALLFALVGLVGFIYYRTRKNGWHRKYFSVENQILEME